MSEANDRALRELIEGVVNGEATAAQHAQLEAQLLASEAARDLYLDYVNLHAALRQRFLAPQDSELVDLHLEMARESFPYPPQRRWRMYVAIAATLLIMVAAAGILPWAKPGNAQPVATLRALEGDATLNSGAGSRPAEVGDLLRAGETLRLTGETARASLEYPDGTQVRMHSGSVVRAPASGTVRLELLTGSLEVAAAKQRPGHPLVFATEHSRYLVLGTRFRLYHEQEASRLELDEGKVRMERPASGETIDVQAGSVAIAANDATPVEVLPLSTGQAELVRTLSNAGQKVEFGGEQLITSNWQSSLQAWRLDDFTLTESYRRDPGYSDGLASAPDGRVVQVNRGGFLLFWKPGEEAALKLSLPGAHTRSRALSPDGTVAAVSADDGTKVFGVDFVAAQLDEQLFITNPRKAWCLALTPQGKRLAAGFWDGTVNVYAVPSGEVLFSRKLSHTPTHCDLTVDAKSLVVATQRDGLVVIDLASGEQRSLWPPGANIVRCLRFSADGRRVLAGFNDRTARMWNVADGRQMLVVEAGHSPQGIAWSEERQLLATADGAVKIWECRWDVPVTSQKEASLK
jgi:WD40 repeat protein